MATSISFLAAQEGGAFGLSESESSLLTEEVYRLMGRHDALGVGEYVQDGLTYIVALGERGSTYTIGRHAGVYFLIEKDFSILALDRNFDGVMKALREALGSYGPAASQRREMHQS